MITEWGSTPRPRLPHHWPVPTITTGLALIQGPFAEHRPPVPHAPSPPTPPPHGNFHPFRSVPDAIVKHRPFTPGRDTQGTSHPEQPTPDTSRSDRAAAHSGPAAPRSAIRSTRPAPAPIPGATHLRLHYRRPTSASDYAQMNVTGGRHRAPPRPRPRHRRHASNSARYAAYLPMSRARPAFEREPSRGRVRRSGRTREVRRAYGAVRSPSDR